MFKIKNEYQYSDKKYWLQNYLKNFNFTFKDNEGGGDCLFAAIRDGLNESDKKISVKELRLKLSNEATEEIFNNYKSTYNAFFTIYSELKNKLKDTAQKLKNLEETNKMIKLANSIDNPENRSKFIQKIDQMIREIDQCIELINL